MSERRYYLDVLRILACVLVVIMHVPIPATGDAVGTIKALFLSGLCYATSPCIGLFMMVSGALLLRNTDRPIEFMRKRLNRVLGPTIFWSIFYILVEYVKTCDLSQCLHSLLSVPFSVQGSGVLWFMYTLIGFYLIVPILSVWLKQASAQEIEFYLLVWCVYLCYPVLEKFVDINNSVTGILYYCSGYAGYFLLGYYLDRYYGRVKMSIVIIALCVALITPFIYLLCDWEIDFCKVFWYQSIFVVFLCTAIFRIVQTLFEKYKLEATLPPPLKISLLKVSNLTYGVYLMHIFIVREILWNCKFIQDIDSVMIQTVVTACVTLVASFLGVYGISMLPTGKYVVGYSGRK